MLLKLDLQLFGEDDLDLDSMLEEFDAEWAESESENEVQEETETDVQEEEEVEGEPTTQEETEEEINPNDPDTHRRNQAFADMRKQLEETRKYAEFIKRLADTGGTTPEELLARFEERQLQAEAERQNVPVEFFKESRETASRLTQLEERMRAERLEMQIESVSSKYGANDDSIRETFRYMLESGIDPRTTENMDFEKFYRAANLDSIIAKEVENARQKDLEDKKKRQASASIGNGTSVSPSDSNELSDEEFEEIAKRMNLRF